MRTLTLTVLCGVLGLAVGYAIFGQFMGQYIPVMELVRLFFNPSDVEKSGFGRMILSVIGIYEIRRNILTCGALGAVLGIVVAVVSRPVIVQVTTNVSSSEPNDGNARQTSAAPTADSSLSPSSGLSLREQADKLRREGKL